MSDTREARPGAPAAPRPPTAPKAPAGSDVRPAVLTGAQTPRPPLVQGSRAPTPPQTPRKSKSTPPPASPAKASEPPESGWDETADEMSGVGIREIEEPLVAPAMRAVPAAPPAPRLGSSADLAPVARRARSSPDLPPVVQATPPARAEEDVFSEAFVPQAEAPRATTQEGASPPVILSEDAQEQVFGVLRAALEATFLPLLEKQQQLEARLEWLHQAEQRAAAAAAAQRASARMAAQAPKIASMAPPADALSSLPPTSVVPTTYGFVTTSDGPRRRPSIELALENVGPIDVPDFGRGRRAAGTVLVGLLLAGVVAAIAATILSYT